MVSDPCTENAETISYMHRYMHDILKQIPLSQQLSDYIVATTAVGSGVYMHRGVICFDSDGIAILVLFPNCIIYVLVICQYVYCIL